VAWVRSESTVSVLTQYPRVDFEITTNGGADLEVAATEVTLQGEGWVDVREIALGDASSPLGPTWTGDQTWQVTVPLQDGANALTLVALDLSGQIIGSDEIVVTSDGGG
jgi:hypothetical protein